MFQEKLFKYFVFLLLITQSYSSPIVIDFNDNVPSPMSPITPFIPKTVCLLPPELGYTGDVKFIEECATLGRYQTVPLPGNVFHKLGSHPVVCCTQPLPKSSICVESDPWCPNYKAPEPVSVDDQLEQQLEQPTHLETDNDETIPFVTDPPVLIQEIRGQNVDSRCMIWSKPYIFFLNAFFEIWSTPDMSFLFCIHFYLECSR